MLLKKTKHVRNQKMYLCSGAPCTFQSLALAIESGVFWDAFVLCFLLILFGFRFLFPMQRLLVRLLVVVVGPLRCRNQAKNADHLSRTAENKPGPVRILRG